MKETQETTNKSGYKSFSSNIDFIEDPRDTYESLYEDMDGPYMVEDTNAYREIAILYSQQLRVALGYMAERIDTFDKKAQIINIAMMIALGCEDILCAKFNSKTQRKIAKMLGVSHNTISHHVSAMRKMLKDNIERNG